MTVEATSFEQIRRRMTAARIAFIGRLAKFNRAELSQMPADGSWSPLQIAYHLYLADGRALAQMQRVQSEVDPHFTDTDYTLPSPVAVEPELTLEMVLAGLAARREEIFEFLATLTSDSWQRPYHNCSDEQCSFLQLVDELPAHDEEHTQQLLTLKELWQ